MKNGSKEISSKFDGIENDNVTKYGEFVTSYFAWLPLNKQKEKADEMDKMTKEKQALYGFILESIDRCDSFL